jgi:hypothetical protein
MIRTDRIWQHADAAFKEADKAFAEADRLFAEINRLSAEDQPDQTFHVKPGTVHQLHFQTRNRREQWRLIKKFLALALGVLFTGKAELHFKAK